MNIPFPKVFLKILSLHKKDMIRWSRNSISWKDFLLKIQDTIKDPIFKKIFGSYRENVI